MASWWARIQTPAFVETKFDGVRRICVKSGEEIFLIGRRHEIDRPPDSLSTAIRRAIPVDATLDCELTAGPGTKTYDVRRKGTEKRLMIFDVLTWDHRDLRRLPYSERKAILRQVRTEDSIQIVEGQRVSHPDDVLRLKADALRRREEGIIVKADVPYGFSQSWLKLKRSETWDVVAKAVEKTPGFLRTGLPTSFLIEAQEDGRGWVELGHATFPFIRQKPLLARLIKTLRTHEDPQYIYLRRFIVFEVKFLERLPSGKLREPHVLRLRDDKPTDACRIPEAVKCAR